MVSLQTITADVFEDVYRTFLADDDPDLTDADWRPLFTPSCHTGPDHAGYALVDGGNIVGMLGTIFSQRLIDGELSKMCSLHSWFVQEAYRGYSLLLMRPVLGLLDHTLTDFTPTNRVVAISQRLGFSTMDGTLRVLFPFAFKRKIGAGERMIACQDGDAVRATLDREDRHVFGDHQLPGIGHLVTTAGGEYCYIVYAHVERYVTPYCHILYISNKPLFARQQAAIRSRLLRETGTRFIAVDDRLVADVRLPFSTRLPIGSQQLYRSRRLSPDKIDCLYSEVSMLRLTTFPDLSHCIRRFLWRLRPTLKSHAGAQI